jgi:hypothetical protein
MKTALLTVVAALLLSGVVPAVRAQNLSELRWDHHLEHYQRADASAYDAWVITPPARESRNPENFEAITEVISKESHQSIAHIFLGELVRRPELQSAVMTYVAAQPEFQQHPPPAGFGRWEFKNSAKLRALVEQGILRSPFVADCNAVLNKHGKAVKAVLMEKLFFTKKDGQWGWDAIVWLKIDPPPK